MQTFAAINQSNSNSCQAWKKNQMTLSKESLEMLFSNEIGAIRVPNFATSEECQKIYNNLSNFSHFKGYGYAENAEAVLKFGPAQCEFGQSDKDDYFEESAQARQFLDYLRVAAINPVDRVQALLKFVAQKRIEIATDENGRKYHAGVFRNIVNGALKHVDWAQIDARGWTIAQADAQISWNLFVHAPQKTNASSIVYNKPWNQSLEQHKVKGSYHYDDRAVFDTEFSKNEFVVGDLVFFNSRNLHSVEVANCERVTMSSFIGRMPNKYVLWS